MNDSDIRQDSDQSSLRRAAREARAALDAETRANASSRIADNVLQSEFFAAADSIGCYVALSDEVDTWKIIEAAWSHEKRIFAPVMRKSSPLTFRRFDSREELVRNNWGIDEPLNGESITPQALDLVITPLVAFDNERNRIGMGGGFYDRTFSFLNDTDNKGAIALIGVAFDCQCVEKITPNPWDIRLLRVFTESQTI